MDLGLVSPEIPSGFGALRSSTTPSRESADGLAGAASPAGGALFDDLVDASLAGKDKKDDELMSGAEEPVVPVQLPLLPVDVAAMALQAVASGDTCPVLDSDTPAADVESSIPVASDSTTIASAPVTLDARRMLLTAPSVNEIAASPASAQPASTDSAPAIDGAVRSSAADTATNSDVADLKGADTSERPSRVGAEADVTPAKQIASAEVVSVEVKVSRRTAPEHSNQERRLPVARALRVAIDRGEDDPQAVRGVTGRNSATEPDRQVRVTPSQAATIAEQLSVEPIDVSAMPEPTPDAPDTISRLTASVPVRRIGSKPATPAIEEASPQVEVPGSVDALRTPSLAPKSQPDSVTGTTQNPPPPVGIVAAVARRSIAAAIETAASPSESSEVVDESTRAAELLTDVQAVTESIDTVPVADVPADDIESPETTDTVPLPAHRLAMPTVV